jgi:hypothetical protein
MKKQKTIKIISSPYAHSFESADLLESSPHALLQMTKLICILPISIGMNNLIYKLYQMKRFYLVAGVNEK